MRQRLHIIMKGDYIKKHSLESFSSLYYIEQAKPNNNNMLPNKNNISKKFQLFTHYVVFLM